MERYLRKYGDSALVAELEKIDSAYAFSSGEYHRQLADLLSAILDITEQYVKRESASLVETVEKLVGRVPEFKALGLGDVVEKAFSLSKEAEVVLERLRAKVEEVRKGEVVYTTLDELFDIVRELEKLWNIVDKFIKFYISIYKDLSPMLILST
ncbi:MAG: hypothetical protein ABWK05_02290 [Pyrobaculum sp.]